MPDLPPQSFPYKFGQRGLVAAYVDDAAPEYSFFNLENLESRLENALSSRLGRTPITVNDGGLVNAPLADTNIHTLGRLKGLSSPYRYAGAGAALYRRAGDTNGAYTSIATGLSGNRFSMLVYRPVFSSFPYIFFADGTKMLKDNGALAAAQNWSITPPPVPPTIELMAPLKTDINLFEADSGFTYSNFTRSTTVNTTLGTVIAAGTRTVTPASMANICVGMVLAIGGAAENVTVTATTATTFTAVFANAHGAADTVTALGIIPRVNTTLGTAVGATGRATCTPASMTNILPGVVLTIDYGLAGAEQIVVLETTATTFTAVFTQTHANTATVTDIFIQGTVAASTTGTVTRAGALNLETLGSSTSEDDDVLNFWLRISDPTAIEEIKLLIDVGDGTFATDYFMKTVTPATFQGVVDGTTAPDQGLTGGVYNKAIGLEDDNYYVRSNVVDQVAVNLDDPILRDLQPTTLLPGDSVWSRLQVKRGEFTAVGLAGTPGKSWANVASIRVSIKTNSTGTVTVGLDDFYLFGGNGLDVFGTTQGYDYRYTFFNLNTGDESNPSQTLISARWLYPRRQPVKVTWTASADTQVTHVRVYRRGGTISSAWYKVGEVAIGTTTLTDTMADSVAQLQLTLEIDNDPAVTSTLQVPVDTTLSGSVTAASTQTVNVGSVTNLYANQYVKIGSGKTEETVIIQSVGATSITAYFQYAHSSGERVYAVARTGRPLNLGAIAFERAWLAGDPDNPHILYYSKRFQPSSFPPQNYLEIGTPSDPIMAVVETRGQLYVFTLSTVWQVVAAGSGAPAAFRTAAAHGLVANFAWCQSEGEIWYLSYDGVYAFRGGQSVYMTQMLRWLFTEQNLGPVSPLDGAQLSSAVMEFFGNEVFLSYINMAGARKRLIYNTTYGRWRNDNVAAQAMLYEIDSYKLIIAMNNGMIFEDRVGDVDNDGYSGGVAVLTPIAYTMESQTLDQGAPKNDKVYTHFALDVKTGASQPATVTLLLNNKATTQSLGTITTTTRDQVNKQVNSGLGFASRNIALRVTGSASTTSTDLFGAFIQASMEAERRVGFDTYWLKYGSEAHKVAKEGLFEYTATAEVTVSCYIEGSTTPKYTFTLPVSASRVTTRVRFPAVKARLWRWVFTSSGNFQLYNDSAIKVKPAGSPDGFAKVNLLAA